jgi:hypothetical protein
MDLDGLARRRLRARADDEVLARELRGRRARRDIDVRLRGRYGKIPRFSIALATRSTATMNAASRGVQS